MTEKKMKKVTLSKLANKFIQKNNNNEDETFKKWKWDALINAIETGKINEAYLIKKSYI